MDPGEALEAYLYFLRHERGLAARSWVFRTNVTAGFGIVTEDFGPS